LWAAKHETREQQQAAKYVRADSCVLELGARYGMVSNVLSLRLLDPTKHVAVEPDARVLSALQSNKRSHGGQYTICPCIVSEEAKELTLGGVGLATRVMADTRGPRLGYQRVKTKSLHALEDEIGCKFDCLVADCEGGLAAFFRQYAHKLQDFHTIILEKDCPAVCDYRKLAHQFYAAGFVPVVDGFHAVYVRDPRLMIHVERSKVAHGQIGLCGFLGYDHGSVYQACVPTWLQAAGFLGTVSAHAPSKLLVRPTSAALLVRGFLNQSAGQARKQPVSFWVDSVCIGTCLQGNEVTSGFAILATGMWHRLEARTKDQKLAHSVWALTCESVE
jgi:FkbM family methyltransferase